MSQESSFDLADKLPLTYDAAISIYSVSLNNKSQKRTHAINSYYTALRTIWIKSFGEEHVMRRKGVVDRLKNILLDYQNKVVLNKCKSFSWGFKQ